MKNLRFKIRDTSTESRKLTLASNTSILSVSAVVNIQSVATAVCEVDLQTRTGHIVQYDGSRSPAKVGVAESQGSAGLVP